MNQKPQSLKLLPLLFLLLVPALARAQFTYITNDDNTITITEYTGSDSIVTVPGNIGGLTVTGIGDGVFSNNITATSITIPNSVTTIGNSTFYACTTLTNVTMSGGVLSIGNDAFYLCLNLTNVTIPDSVTNIGAAAFNNCVGLLTIARIPPVFGSIKEYSSPDLTFAIKSSVIDTEL